MAKEKEPWVPRHVQTEGHNDGRDCADLFAQGITGKKYYQWLKDHMTTGPIKVKIPPIVPAKPRKKSEPKPEPPPESPPEAPKEIPETDYGIPPAFSEDALAEKFTDSYRDSLLYCKPAGTWYAWLEGRWQRDDTAVAIDCARKICKLASSDVMAQTDLGSKRDRISSAISSRRMFSNVEAIARTDRRHVVSPNRFDAKPWILNTPDGVVDLKTGELRPAKRGDYCTYVTNTSPGGECPRWLAFLDEATQGDAELKLYLKRVAGYCLTGAITEHKFFFCYGGGGNGKGTYVNTLDFLLGSYSKVANMDTFTEQRFAKHSTEIAFFQGARLITAQEIDEGSKWNESRLKALTGGDPITARHMYESEFTFYPTFKILFSGNNKPILKNVDAAMRRRMYLIPFDYKVPEEKRDGQLGNYLREVEGKGILQWAIEGCLDWQLNSLNPPDRVRLTTDEYFEDEDKIGTFFDECCEVGLGYREITARLYQRYREWCEKTGEYAVSRKRFLAMIAAKGYRSKNRSGQMSVQGIKLPDAYRPESGSLRL